MISTFSDEGFSSYECFVNADRYYRVLLENGWDSQEAKRTAAHMVKKTYKVALLSVEDILQRARKIHRPPYLNKYIEHRGRKSSRGSGLYLQKPYFARRNDSAVALWLREEIKNRPYLESAFGQIDADFTGYDDSFPVLVSKVNALDFNAFLQGETEEYKYIEVDEDDDKRIKTGITIYSDSRPATIWNLCCQSTMENQRGVYYCWITKRTLNCTNEFSRYIKEAVLLPHGDSLEDVRTEYIAQQTRSQYALSDLCKKHMGQSEVTLSIATIEQLKTVLLHIELSDNPYVFWENRTSAAGNQVFKAVYALLQEVRDNVEAAPAVRSLMQPFINSLFSYYLTDLRHCTEEIQAGSLERKHYNRRKKLRQKIKPITPLLSSDQVSAFWDVYNEPLPGSLREREIQDLLLSCGCSFEREKTFTGLVDDAPLRFDFVINDGDAIKIIEYDGELHYYVPESRGGQQKLQKTKEHDKMKDEFCKSNNIPLLRLSYRQPIKEQNQLIKEFIETASAKAPIIQTLDAGEQEQCLHNAP